MKAKLPIRHPSGDIQLVVGSGILKFRDEVWPGGKNTHCVSVPLALFLAFEPAGLIIAITWSYFSTDF